VVLAGFCGQFCATVRLCRSLLTDACFAHWSVDELAVVNILQSATPRSYCLRSNATWSDILHLPGCSLVAAKLSSLSGFQHDKAQVGKIFTVMRDHTESSHSDCQSRVLPRSLMWVMSSGATGDTLDGGEDMDFDSSPAVGISEHLRNTAVQRAAHCKSDRCVFQCICVCICLYVFVSVSVSVSVFASACSFP